MIYSFLVGMLAYGENEKDEAIAALRRQQHDHWDFFLIEGRPNKEAHEALYARFAEGADDYDLFLKLDADMVLLRPTALTEISAHFDANPRLAALGIDLIDFYTDALMPCLVCVTDQVSWPRHDDALMVDSYMNTRGERLRLSSREEAVAAHSPNPSALQAFRFGVHRATKAIQHDRPRERRTLDKAEVQWRLLEQVWTNFVRTGDRRIGLAIAGAELALGGGEAYRHSYVDPTVTAACDAYAKVSADDLFRELAPLWGDAAANERRWRALLER